MPKSVKRSRGAYKKTHTLTLFAAPVPRPGLSVSYWLVECSYWLVEW